MFETMILIGVGGLILTSITHSVAGEIYLLLPLFKHRGNRVLESELARTVLRFAWHITSVAWLVLALILYTFAFKVADLGAVILVSIGASFTAIGLVDMVASKGKHIGWPMLTLTGLGILAAYIYY